MVEQIQGMKCDMPGLLLAHKTGHSSICALSQAFEQEICIAFLYTYVRRKDA